MKADRLSPDRLAPDPLPSAGSQHRGAELAGRRVAATLGVIFLGAFWWSASGPSNGTVTFLAGLGFAVIATLALLDAALGGDARRK